MEGYDKKDEVFSKVVRAGKRTYFFDVKTTRKNDYYLTVTESKKRFSDDGQVRYEKHKIFLYKEDFEKFTDGFTEAVEFIKSTVGDDLEKVPTETEKPESSIETDDEIEIGVSSNLTDIDFEDLGK